VAAYVPTMNVADMYYLDRCTNIVTFLPLYLQLNCCIIVTFLSLILSFRYNVVSIYSIKCFKISRTNIPCYMHAYHYAT